MRSLIQPSVVKSAGFAAVLTTLACWPRLALWPMRRDAVWFLLVFILWAAFFLWSFVFAWQEKHSGRPVFRRAIPARLWVAVTLCGLCGAAVLRWFLDPLVHQWLPLDFPSDLATWGAMLLFTLGLEQLFLCFAPLALFARLFHRIVPAMAATVCFGVLVMLLKLQSAAVAPAPLVLLALVLFRVAGGFLVLHFYVNGGVLLVWWWAVLVQSRHLLELAGGGS